MRQFLRLFFLITVLTAGFGADLRADDSQAPTRIIPNSSVSDATAPRAAAATGVDNIAAARTTVSRTAVPKQNFVDAASANDFVKKNDDAPDDLISDPVNNDFNRGASARNQTLESARAAVAASRNGISRNVSSSDRNLNLIQATSGRNPRTAATSMNNSGAARRAGLSLRPTTAEVGGRAVIEGTTIQTGSNFDEMRSVQTRAAANKTITKETIVQATERLEQTADLNKSCQLQYNDCMDQFCAVIDANQKRCSCSASLSRYVKVETAVKDANVQLNEVAQRIRYVGLSADEIRAIMSATEAELALSGNKDNTESRNMLTAIEKLIKNPTTTTTATDTSGLDFNFEFTSDATELFNLDFLGNASSSFSNLRGTELYSAAKKRCNTVLTQCKDAGGSGSQITGNYDLSIDKDCIAYEKGLAKMNETLKTNVRSAGQMLQKARLTVLENKNQYDAKGCIAALNNCMIDDMVCGADYSKCLDPTKKYIDENGKVVLGQNISDITAFMASYNNSAIDTTFLSNSEIVNLSSCKTEPNNDGKCVAKYLLQKIGMGKTVKDGGLCRAVLDKCQMVSYNNGVYNKHNDVIVNYVQRAMVNIQSAQKQIISDYASNCMLDIATCYNQQVSQVNAWSSSASTESVYNVMRGACRNVALTCSYAVFAAEPNLCPISDPSKCIDSVSDMFYQSLLCPDNSSYQAAKGTTGYDGYVNERCKCNYGKVLWGNTCTTSCTTPGYYRNQLLGSCDRCPAGTYSATGLDSGSCSSCPAGNYCPVGSSYTTICPANKYCPAGVAAPIDCPVGTWSAQGSGSLINCT